MRKMNRNRKRKCKDTKEAKRLGNFEEFMEEETAQGSM